MLGFFYTFSVKLYGFLIWLASFFNLKAKKWIDGRKLKIEEFPVFSGKKVWIHCASLGEFEQGRPIIEAIKKNFPLVKIYLSFFSPSGYEIRKNYPLADFVFYLPLDTTSNARKLITQLNPSLVIFVKYEFWLNLLNMLHHRQIPHFLICARFYKNQVFFSPLGNIFKQALKNFTHLFVQDETSKKLLKSIQVNSIVAGDTRFDRVLELLNTQLPEFINSLTDKHSSLFVFGSTWPVEHKWIVDFVQTKELLNWKFLIVPHNINQGELNFFRNQLGNNVCYFTQWNKVDKINAQVFVVDAIGYLGNLYKLANVVYVGGGFNGGVHNTLEAAVYGKPIFVGKKSENFVEIKEMAYNGGLRKVQNSTEFKEMLTQVVNNKLRFDGTQNAQYVEEKKGATNLIMRSLENFIK